MIGQLTPATLCLVHRRGLYLVWPLAVLAIEHAAHGGGFEYPGPGTRALGRGAAHAVGSRGPMTLIYNPALLSGAGRAQLLLNVHAAFNDACVQRSGTYTDNTTIHDRSIFGDSTASSDAGGYALEPFPEVCRQRLPGLGPALAGVVPLTRTLGIGIGLFAPVTGGESRWGPDDGTVSGVNGHRRPNPLRYAAIRSGGFMLWPSIGIGWRAQRWLRVGATLQSGLASLDVTSYAVASGGENPSLDARAQTRVSDLFIPALIIGAHASPLPGVELAASFRYADRFSGTGDVDLRFGDFGTGQPGSTVATDNKMRGARMQFSLPWQLVFGMRYVSQRRAGTQATRHKDALGDERWDIELDLTYEFNSRVDEVVLHPPADTVLTWREVRANGQAFANQIDKVAVTRAPRGWRDQIGVRLGGDINIWPAQWALRWGLSFESRGIDPALASPDFLPARRFGLHLGTTIRLASHWEVSLAYAHLFQETITARPANQTGGAAGRQVATDGSGRVINAGRYRGRWNIISIGGNYRF